MPGRSCAPNPTSGRVASSGYSSQQAGGERAGAVGSTGMNHDARRLVDDDHSLVGVHDSKRDLARQRRRQQRRRDVGQQAKICLEDVVGSDTTAAGRRRPHLRDAPPPMR